jgi:flagellar FliL protein
MINLDAFLVNLADTDSTRFVKVTFRLGLDEASLGEELAGDQIVLSATRDKIISLLSTKTAEELLTLEGKDKLRNEIRERVNPILPKGKIVEVFIMDFVIQM